MLFDEKGFSLLEVVVALAIMSFGFLAVLQLYSMSIRSLGHSEKFLLGTMLAQSKMSELEVNNFKIEQDEGEFEDGFRWIVRVLPYDSPLNNEEENIQLSKVKLWVYWSEDGKVHSVDLNTIKLNSSTIPLEDKRLAEKFKGGNSLRKLNDRDLDNDRDLLQILPPP